MKKHRPLPLPKRVPKLGFYYHYKHDPRGEINNYAYEVVGVGFHTEGDARKGEEHFLVYRPLYEASVYKMSKKLGIPCFDARPLKMWMGNVEVGGERVPRFKEITDPAIIRKMKKVSVKMYQPIR